jgi:hypothetical protein
LRLRISLSDLFGRNFGIEFPWKHFHCVLNEIFLILDFFEKLAPFNQ